MSGTTGRSVHSQVKPHLVFLNSFSDYTSYATSGNLVTSYFYDSTKQLSGIVIFQCNLLQTLTNELNCIRDGYYSVLMAEAEICIWG